MTTISTELFILSHNPFLVDLPVLYRMHSQLGKQGKHSGSSDAPSRSVLYVMHIAADSAKKKPEWRSLKIKPNGQLPSSPNWCLGICWDSPESLTAPAFGLLWVLFQVALGSRKKKILKWLVK